MLAPFGLASGRAPQITLTHPLGDFYRRLSLQRGDVRFTNRQSTATQFPAAGRRTFPSKVWVHRTNSFEKLNRLFDNFQGVELDLVFHTQEYHFDVTHLPAPPIELTLEEFLAGQRSVAAKYLCLDFKNLSNDNAEAALNRLSAWPTSSPGRITRLWSRLVSIF